MAKFKIGERCSSGGRVRGTLFVRWTGSGNVVPPVDGFGERCSSGGSVPLGNPVGLATASISFSKPFDSEHSEGIPSGTLPPEDQRSPNPSTGRTTFPEHDLGGGYLL